MTSGTRESLIHLLMIAEVGVPLTLVLLCEVNPLVLTTIAASIAAHEATALWTSPPPSTAGVGVDADHGRLGARVPELAGSP